MKNYLITLINNMMKRIYPFILLILCAIYFPGKTFGQNDVDEIKLKEFLNEYQNCSMLYEWSWNENDKGEYIEVLQELPDNIKQFKTLLFDGCILYFELDSSRYYQYTSSDYIIAYRDFLIDKDIRIQKSEIEYFEINNSRPGGIIRVSLTKTIYYDPRLFDRPMNPSEPMLEIKSKLVFTLFYDCLNKKYKLLKVDKDEHLFSDGLGSSKWIPQSLTLKGAYLVNLFSNDFFSEISGKGYDFTLKANYLLGGSNNLNRFNLYLSPGLKFYHDHLTYSRNSFKLPDITQFDIDDHKFNLLMSGEILEQSTTVNYIGIPIDLKLFLSPGIIKLSFEAGLMYSFPLSPKVEIDNADINYTGEYMLPQPADPEFGQQTFIFDNLPEYGFMNYSKDQFSGISQIDLNKVLSGHLGINVGYDIDPRWRIELGADLYTGFSSMVKTNEIDSLIGSGEVYCPNLLVYENQFKNTSVGFGINLTYNLKRTNIPYRSNLKNKDVEDYMCVKGKTSVCKGISESSINSSKINVRLFLENDPYSPAKTRSYQYTYCGVTKSNSQKGAIRLGKESKYSLDVPTDNRKTEYVQFAIRKPYMVDIYKDSLTQNTDDEYFSLNYNDLMELNSKGALTLYTKNIPEIDIYYVSVNPGDQYYNPMNFKEFLYDYITDEPRKNLHDILLYCAYKDGKSAVLTSSEENESVRRFCDMVYDFKPNGIYNDIITFKSVLQEVPCDRRNVNLYFILNSASTYIDIDLKMAREVILKILEDKFGDNYENVRVKIIMPYDPMNYNHKSNQELYNIFEKDKKPIDVFDFEFENYYKQNK
jgi:hypothetical protein